MGAQPKVVDANYLKEVREHYENYPYPPMNPEDERHRALITITEAFDILNHVCYSGRKDFSKDFRALVAGGGTGDAIIALAEQLRGTEAEVVYVDMSESSMKVAQKRAEVRGLTNIRWIRDSLLNIPKLDLGKFDYINSSGVLHHLENPDLGLRTLSDALKDDGAMGIMVYAQYGRMAVYMMQETLRIINEDEPNLQTRVDNAKAVLNNMPATNWFLNSSPMILNEISCGDIAIYDLLLHSQDRAYTIPELYAFVEGAGLNILHFFCDYPEIGQNLYNPAYYIPDAKLAAEASTWPLREQQALAEMLHGKIEKHTFYAAKRIPKLPDPHDLEMIPLLGYGVYSEHEGLLQALHTEGEFINMNQPGYGTSMTIAKTPHLIKIVEQINGKRTLGEIFERIKANTNVDLATLQSEFATFLQTMSKEGWLYLRHKSTVEVLHHDVFQARIPK